jgi:hypothetical protein
VIFVNSFSRLPTDIQAADWGQPPLQHVAFAAAVVLVNLTLPVPPVPLPAGLSQALGDHAGSRSAQYAQWPPVRWQVDGAAVTARGWRFAGGWAAVSDAVPDVYLAAAGLGTGPDGLSLAVLRDGGGYHFTLDQPLHPDVMAASRAARAGGDRPLPDRPGWHADQLRLIRSGEP